jgi:hypothetical protein
MIKACYIACFELTSLLWDLNEDRSNPYLNALKDRTPENVCEFLSKWNRGRGYKKEILLEKIKVNQGKLKEVPSNKELENYLKFANQVLKEVTSRSDEEYVGSVKLSHIYHPNIFPIIDNPILEEFGLNKYDSGDFKGFVQQYFSFKDALDEIIKEFGLNGIKVREREGYKLIDEVLYLFITQEKSEIVEDILTITGNRLFVQLIKELVQKIKDNIKNS